MKIFVEKFTDFFSCTEISTLSPTDDYNRNNYSHCIKALGWKNGDDGQIGKFDG